MRPEFEITETTEQGRRIIGLKGELDLGTVPLVSARLQEPWPAREMVLDLSGLTFADTTGMGFLIEAQREAEARGRTLVLRNPSARIRATLRISGLLPHLRFSTE